MSGMVTGSTGRPAARVAASRRWSCTAARAPVATRGGAACSTRGRIASCCSTSAVAAGACPTPASLTSTWRRTRLVTTTTRREIEWVTRDAGRFFPAQWLRFRDGVPAGDRDGSLVEAYHRLLLDADPAVHEQAARDWCAWEDAHVRTRPADPPDSRYDDPVFRLGFARLVTHYWRHAAWLPAGALLRNVEKLADIRASSSTGASTSAHRWMSRGRSRNHGAPASSC